MKWTWTFALLLVPALAPADTKDVRAKTVQVTGWAGSYMFGELARQDAYSLRNFMLSPTAAYDPADGTLRLAASELIVGETGATDYHQTEPLGASRRAKKVFRLHHAGAQSAELFFYGSAAHVTFNGKPLAAPTPLQSTGWSRVAVPPELLTTGANEVVFSGGGALLVEPGRPGDSYKSGDGGRTWSRDGLTGKATQQGEYLVRLRLGRHPANGWALSQVFDLWDVPGKTVKAGDRVPSNRLPWPCRNVRVGPLDYLNEGQPEGTQLTAYLRSGGTPLPSDEWTGWTPLDQEHTVPDNNRWAQVKFVLATADPAVTPRLTPKLYLPHRLEQVQGGSGKFTVTGYRPEALLQGPVPFTYQAPSPRLKMLREKYKLDEVIAPGKTELEQLMLLRHWVRNQWHTAWGSHPSQWMPPWDAHIILESHGQPDCLTMCTHYAAVFTQCCLALGWDARHCILDHHCVAEVYLREHDRWAMMDAGNSPSRADVTLHFERGGVPLSARELHLAYTSGDTGGIRVRFVPADLAGKIAHLCRPAPKGMAEPPPADIPLSQLRDYPVCQLENYRRYAFPARNNYLDSLLPGELYQGWSSYFYDGYCWVGDSPDAPKISPEYSLHIDPRRPGDADWKLGHTRVYLSRTDEPGRVRVDLATLTPNLKGFEKELRQSEDDTAAPEAAPTSFVWQLQPGVNRLSVRSINAWGKKGRPAEVTVEWHPE